MGLLDDPEAMNKLMQSPLVQAGLGMLAGNRGQYAMQNALAGGAMGLHQAGDYNQQQVMNKLRQQQADMQQKQFDTQQANRLQDRDWQVGDKNQNRQWQVADKTEARGYQVSDAADEREFQRLMGKEKFGQQLSLQEKSFMQQYGLQRNAQNFQAGQNALGRQQQIDLENIKQTNKPARGMSIAAQKELMDTEDATQGSKQAVNSFKKALSINNDAMGGLGAGTLANIGSVLPDFARPKAVDSTKELDNVLQGSALPQLKAIFGGMPTEGERAILLEVQGSSAQPAKVREGIFNRAIEAANKRIQYNTEKSKQLRNGTYFTEDGGVNIPDAPQEQIAQPDFKSLAEQELARRRKK